MKKSCLLLLLPLMLSVGLSGFSGCSSAESVFNTDMIHYLGRTVVTDTGVKFAMSCSGFEIKINVTGEGSAVTAELDSYCDSIGGESQFAYVYIDGEEPSERLEISSSKTTYTLAENLTEGNHYIRFIKLNEGIYTNITLKSLGFTGSKWLKWDKTYDKRIEFYGDSITCGYGNESSTPSAYSYNTQNGAHTYAYTCAEELGYEPSVCAESGMSLCMDSWNHTKHLEDIYTTYDGTNAFDVSGYKVDIAVICIGTNDNTVFTTLSAKDQETEIENIYGKYKELGAAIKTNNPDCKIFFIYNLMLRQNAYIDTAIAGACNDLNDAYGEGTAYYLEFAPDNNGGAGHPYKDAHIRDGKILAEFIRNPEN